MEESCVPRPNTETETSPNLGTRLYSECSSVPYHVIINQRATHDRLSRNMNRKETDMLEACRSDHVNTVKRLITDRSVDVNVNLDVHRYPGYGSDDDDDDYLSHPFLVPMLDQCTPLYVACLYRRTEVVKYLLSLPHCQVNCICGLRDRTPLHAVCLFNTYIDWTDNTYIVELLLARKDCDPNVKDRDGNTPLLLACKNGYNRIVQLLLSSSKCDPNVRNKAGDTPLHLTSQHKRTQIIQLLLTDQQCDPNVENNRGETLLHVACEKGNAIVVKTLLTTGKCGLNLRTKTGDTPLHLAAGIKDTQIIQLLLADPQCVPNVTNEKGETPLHVAFAKGNAIVVKTLLATGKCAPNVQMKTGDTPLHLASRIEDAQIIKLLLTDPQCDPNVTNNQGDTPLHIACEKGNAIVVKKLLEIGKYGLNLRTKTGDTPLHLATRIEDTQIIQLLLADPKCDPNVTNNQGETPLHVAWEKGNAIVVKTLLATGKCAPNVQMKTGDTPLHLATRIEDAQIIKLLLADPKCDPNVINYRGETPLHVACWRRNAVIVKTLLGTDKCDPNIQTKFGSTPLHLAARIEDTQFIQLLLADPQCDLNVTNDQDETPLHVALLKRNAVVVKILLKTGKCDPNVQTKTGDTPLHVATRLEDTQIIQLLLADPQCDPNVTNNQGDTPLHIAVAIEDQNSSKLVECFLNSSNSTNLNHRNAKGDTAHHVAVAMEKPAIVKLLVSSEHCNPNVRDQDGNTPLSIACQMNETEIVTLLLSSGRADPECVNNAGKTPVELATNYLVIQKISSLTEARHKHPIETFVKIFIIGNAETGKSTLIQAICTEASKVFKLWGLPASYKQVKPEDVEPHTAGIIPRHFRSKHFGNTVLYDFAGQHEYYSSHAAVVENVAVPTPPAFVVVVDISEPIDLIMDKLTYWWSFIENHCKRTSAPPPVMLVGSHKDIIKARKESVKERMKVILHCLESIPTTFDFAGHIAIDCRLLASTGLDKLLVLLNEACKSLRKTSDVDFRCHVLYAFLTDKFRSFCKVSELISQIRKEDTLLPQNPAELKRLISTLSDKGQVLLLKNASSPKDSWIVLQAEKLLSEVNGSIFAPDEFRQHVKDFARSTGVVPRSKIEHQFRQYPLDIVIGFLSHLEFCFKINDYQTLDMITDEWEPESHATSPSDQDEEFYFFPALVRVEYPTDMWKQPSTETQKPGDPPMTFQCGWFYQCSLSNQFLTSRFLHVLILRLAFKFALAVERPTLQ